MDSDRDILIRLDQKVSEIHRDMTQPEGRVPRLEAKVEVHATQISTASGSLKTLLWVISGIGILAMAFGGVLLAHILGGK